MEEIIKITGEINKIEYKKIQNITETNSRIFEKINEMDKHLTRLIKKKRERTTINKIRNERGE